MAEITVSNRTLNGIAAHDPAVQRRLWAEAKKVEAIADRRLQSIRASTEWYKIDPASSPAHVTRIELQRDQTEGKTPDYLVNMVALNAWALEYGHKPSGVFGPGGRLSHVKTKAPRATYLMTMTFVEA